TGPRGRWRMGWWLSETTSIREIRLLRTPLPWYSRQKSRTLSRDLTAEGVSGNVESLPQLGGYHQQRRQRQQRHQEPKRERCETQQTGTRQVGEQQCHARDSQTRRQQRARRPAAIKHLSGPDHQQDKDFRQRGLEEPPGAELRNR